MSVGCRGIARSPPVTLRAFRRRRPRDSGGRPRRIQPVDATPRICVSSGGVAMKQRPRIYYSERQKALMWERWRKGETIHQIGKLFDRGHSSVQRILAEAGGIEPRRRRRAPQALTLAERRPASGSPLPSVSLNCPEAVASALGRYWYRRDPLPRHRPWLQEKSGRNLLTGPMAAGV